MIYQLIAPMNEHYSVVEQILTNRGIEHQNIPKYLNTTDADIYPPEMLDNIQQAANLIIKHLAQGKIYVQVDSDCDGYTSSAVLLNYLHALLPSAIDSKVFYGFHPGKQHGINLELVPAGTTLVITPDSSSNDYEIHKTLSEQSIDVVVLDHHQAEKVSEHACVVNNQLCDYPTKSLSGVGIVYKLCQYLDKQLKVNYADNYLDLVSLGLIADLMDVRDFETIHLIRKGIDNIRNPFISAMIEKNQFKLTDNITPIGIAFYVAPFVNAITRVGQEEEKRTLFEAMLEWKAYESIPSTKRGCKGQLEKRVEQAVRYCTNVKTRQTTIRDRSLEVINDLINQYNLLDHKILMIKLENPIDPGLTGLIANKLADTHQRPVCIFNKIIDNNEIKWMGSARGYNGFAIDDFKSFVRDSGLVLLAEGHPNAFGIGVADENFDKLLEYADKVLYNIDFTPSYKVDFIYSAQDLKPIDILDIGGMKSLWGQNVGEAMIAVENIKITADRLTLMSRDKNPTLKITLPNGVECIKFKSSEEELESLTSSGCVVINIVGKCDVNEYFNKIKPQILIENYDIIAHQEYYF